MSEQEDRLLESTTCTELMHITKKLIKKGYEVRLTANNGVLVYIEDGMPMVHLSNGKKEAYHFSLADVCGVTTWGLGYRKKGSKEPYKGILDYRRRFGCVTQQKSLTEDARGIERGDTEVEG